MHSSVQAGTSSIPFLGTVAAGIPIEVVQTAESIEVPENFLGNGSNFALRVRGDSMIEDGIRDGDILIITQQPQAENGQTVVALVAGEATVKKFYRRENEIELKPANSRMKSIVASVEEVEVVGVVMGLLRNYRNHRHLAGRGDSGGNSCPEI
jgi:repressor LexA